MKKENICLNEDSSSNEYDSDSDSRRVIFMESKGTIENNEYNYEEEGEVNIEAKLISSLHDMIEERNKRKNMKEELSKMKESC